MTKPNHETTHGLPATVVETRYTRPTKSKASAVGERNRTRWSRHLRKKLLILTDGMTGETPEEIAALEALRYQAKGHGRTPRWATLRIRRGQMATLELLQMRHLQSTGKETSKAEVLAALMAGGLESVLNHKDFGGTPA